MSDLKTTALNNRKSRKQLKFLSRLGIDQNSIYNKKLFPFLSKNARTEFYNRNPLYPQVEEKIN